MKEFKISVLHTNRTAVFNRYIAEVNQIPLITPEEEVTLAKLIREGDLKAKEKLINANLRFVVSVAKKYEGVNGSSLNDLISEGNIGLINAANRFDETYGFKFISFAIWHIRQTILLSVSNNAFIRLPINKVASNYKIKRAYSDLEQDLERDPDPSELARVLEEIFTSKEIEEQLGYNRPIQSLDVSLFEDGSTLVDVIPNLNAGDPIRSFEIEEIEKNISKGLDKLTGEEKLILELYFGLSKKEDTFNIREISEITGMGAGRVGDLKKRALRKLRMHYRNKPFATQTQ